MAMTRIITVACLVALMGTAAIFPGTARGQSQDKIYTSDNQILIGEVLAVQATQTKYIPIGSEVFLNIANSRIFKIEFANGTIQLFRDGVAQAPVEPELTPLPGIAPGGFDQTSEGTSEGDRMRQLYEKLKKKNINEMTQREYEFFKLMQAEEMRGATGASGGSAVFTPYRRQLIQGMACSVIVPGGGHFYLGKRDRGLGFLMGSIPAVAALFASNDQLRMVGFAGLAVLKVADLLTIPGEINK
jgi:hypothetical protein